VPCGRNSRFRVRPCRRRIGSDGLHLEREGAGPRAPLSAVVGRLGFYGGHLEAGVAFPSGAAAGSGASGSGACMTRQSSAIAPALPCYARHTCVVRHGLLGSARLSSYACPARRDPSPGRPHPLQAPAVIPRTPRPRPGETGIPPQVPAVVPRTPRPRRGEPAFPLRCPPLETQSAPRQSRNQGPPPPGTDARRNGVAAAARSASVPRLTRRPRHRPEDAERSEAPKTSRRGARPCGTRRRSPSPPGP
jgi:hypothetical protein